MICLTRAGRTALLVLALLGGLLAGCSSSSSNAGSPSSSGSTSSSGPDASEGTSADDAAGANAASGDAAGSADAGADAFSSCPTNRPATGSFPSDVAAVLADKCQTCHQSPPKNHAPFPLLTYAETQGPDPLSPYTGLPIWQVMHTVIQPKGVPHMPFGNAPQLTSAEMTTLDDWLLACALPQGEAEGGGSPSGDASAPADASSPAEEGGASSDAGGQ